MGKASKTKRERREQEAAAERAAAAAASERRSLPVFWITVALLVVAGIGALVVTSPDDAEKARDAEAAKVPTYSEVSVEGSPLPTWDGTGSDAAEGEQVPTLGGEKFDGFRTTLDAEDGTARVYVVLAHWCPHCQDEVPRIVDWARDHELPEGVEVVAVSTAVDDGQPNFPPAAWLAEERWPYDVLIDDEVGSAAEALGVEGFPFLVFAGADGTVVERYSGEMPIREFDAAVRRLGETVASGDDAA